jgi:hypothetical protein
VPLRREKCPISGLFSEREASAIHPIQDFRCSLRVAERIAGAANSQRHL